LSTVDLFHVADQIIRIAKAEGAEQTEAFIESRENLVMRITKVSGKDNFTTRDQAITGAGIRVIKGGALGFAYLSNLTDDSVRSSVRSALKVAEHETGLDRFHGKPSGYPSVAGILDKHTAEMRPDEVMANLEELRKAAKEVDAEKITIYDALFGRSKHGFAVVNTEGLRAEDYGSFARMALGISARDQNREAKLEIYNVQRAVKDLGAVRDFASKSSRRILKHIGPEKMESGRMTAVLGPQAVAELFTYAFADAFCANNIQSKASPLEGKIGQQVASNIVTLVDDGTYEGGLTSFKMDDEGMPSKKTSLIENGILKGYLHSNQTAGVASTVSTGNCVRWEMPAVDYFYYRSFRRLPRIYPTNLILKPGNTPIETMIREIKNGIYIERTDPAFTARPDGSFSTVVLNGVRIRNGELGSPARDFRIAGNLFDYAKKIDAIGNIAEKWIPQLYPSAIVTPPFRIQDVTIQS
jgi:PmbA protein